MREKVADYHRMDVEHVWVLNPGFQEPLICTPLGWSRPENDLLVVPGIEIVVPVSQIFASLDEWLEPRDNLNGNVASGKARKMLPMAKTRTRQYAELLYWNSPQSIAPRNAAFFAAGFETMQRNDDQ